MASVISKAKKIEMFPKGVIKIDDVLSLRFISVNKGVRCAIARYEVVISSMKGNDLKGQIRPFLRKNVSFVAGIRSAFIQSSSSKKIEFLITVDFSKAGFLFKAKERFHTSIGSIISKTYATILFKTQLTKFGIKL